MRFTNFFTLLAAGYGVLAQNPTEPDETTSAVSTATATPPKQPGTSFSCRVSGSGDVPNSEGICGAVGGKFDTFSGCCLDSAASGTEASYTQGCSDNGGSVSKSQVPCDLAA